MSHVSRRYTPPSFRLAATADQFAAVIEDDVAAACCAFARRNAWSDFHHAMADAIEAILSGEVERQRNLTTSFPGTTKVRDAPRR
jgi:hypothetical protein